MNIIIMDHAHTFQSYNIALKKPNVYSIINTYLNVLSTVVNPLWTLLILKCYLKVKYNLQTHIGELYVVDQLGYWLQQRECHKLID